MLKHVTLVVRDYDEAIAFFTQSLGFDPIEDTPSKDRQGRDKRWVLIALRVRRARKSCSRKPRTKAKPPGSAIKPEAALFSSSTRLIFGVTTRR